MVVGPRVPARMLLSKLSTGACENWVTWCVPSCDAAVASIMVATETKQ